MVELSDRRRGRGKEGRKADSAYRRKSRKRPAAAAVLPPLRSLSLSLSLFLSALDPHPIPAPEGGVEGTSQILAGPTYRKEGKGRD